MTEVVKEFLSKNAYAALIGVSEKAIRKAIAEGKIIKGWDADKQKIRVKEANEEYGFLHQSATAKAGVSKAKRVEKITAKTAQKSSDRSEENKTKSEVLRSPKFSKGPAEKSEEEDAAKAEVSEDLNYEDLLLKIPVHDKLSYQETVRRREILQLALDKKKLEELEGVLVRKTDVMKVLFTVGDKLKKAIAAMPARVIDDVLSAETKVEALNVMNEEITNILDSYANFGKVNIENKD